MCLCSLTRNFQWLDRVSAAITTLKATQTPPLKLSGVTAAHKIVSAPHEPYDIVGLDTIEASRLGVALGDTVQVAPDDYGKSTPHVRISNNR